ncbi:MAG TPA: tetratricopeptide repeat protein [Terriglobia bacterium]|nr:tetratricopeptide repeat protein [Terriglobia bacterium]
MNKPWLIPLALVATVVIAYSNSLHGKLVFDDQLLVLQNSDLMNIHRLGDVVSQSGGGRGLLFMTYGLNYYLSGTDTFSYHLFNVALHALNTLLVYWIISAALQENKNQRLAAIAGAAVFSVHTLFTSAVSYIAGRSSVLCATFYFSAVLLFFKALDTPKRNVRILYLALTAIAGLLAWNTKQEAITLPLLLAGVLFLRTERKNWRWIVPMAAIPPLVVLLMRDRIAALYASVSENKALVSAGFEKVLPPATYFRTYLTSVVEYYFPRFMLPVGLSADPQIEPIEHWYSPEFLVSILMFGALAWLAIHYAKREPLFSLGLTALLVSPLMAYAAIPLADVVLEHRAYIPGLGVAFLFAWMFQWVARHYSHSRWVALGALVVVLAGMTVARNNVWADNISLWEDAEAKAPQKARPHFNLGQAYQEAQRLPEASREYEHALAIKPDISAAYSNIAAIDLDRGQYSKAEQMLLKVTSLSPDFTEGFINLGVFYIRTRATDKAIDALNRAVKLNRESFPAHFNKGEALTQKGDFKAALESYKEAVRLRPDIDAFRLGLAAGYVRAGEFASAEKEYMALMTTPVGPEAARNLGVLYRDSGDTAKAMAYFNQAGRMRTVFPELHHDIGILYLKKSMVKEAIEQFEITIREQPDYAPAYINLALAYQAKGDLQTARQTLLTYLQKYENSNSPYVPQVRQRLELLK